MSNRRKNRKEGKKDTLSQDVLSNVSKVKWELQIRDIKSKIANRKDWIQECQNHELELETKFNLLNDEKNDIPILENEIQELQLKMIENRRHKKQFSMDLLNNAEEFKLNEAENRRKYKANEEELIIELETLKNELKDIRDFMSGEEKLTENMVKREREMLIKEDRQIDTLELYQEKRQILMRKVQSDTGKNVNQFSKAFAAKLAEFQEDGSEANKFIKEIIDGMRTELLAATIPMIRDEMHQNSKKLRQLFFRQNEMMMDTTETAEKCKCSESEHLHRKIMEKAPTKEMIDIKQKQCSKEVEANIQDASFKEKFRYQGFLKRVRQILDECNSQVLVPEGDFPEEYKMPAKMVSQRYQSRRTNIYEKWAVLLSYLLSKTGEQFFGCWCMHGSFHVHF